MLEMSRSLFIPTGTRMLVLLLVNERAIIARQQGVRATQGAHKQNCS